MQAVAKFGFCDITLSEERFMFFSSFPQSQRFNSM